ncbi:hypothetical protein Btru_026694 [Bulinus truncatus]|nr:hypothetical protein Btru_026694 [Bulinus truncatus]
MTFCWLIILVVTTVRKTGLRPIQKSGHSHDSGYYNDNDCAHFSPLTLSATLDPKVVHATNIVVLPECLIVRHAGIYQGARQCPLRPPEWTVPPNE